MHGNVWEWGQDCDAGNYAKAPVDGSKAPDAEDCCRVLRGGFWYLNPAIFRSASRSRYPPGYRGNLLGFRLARTLPTISSIGKHEAANKELKEKYPQLNTSLSLNDCSNHYVTRIKSKKSWTFESTFHSREADAYFNKWMYAFFDSKGDYIDPYKTPPEERTIIDGGDDLSWTLELKENQYEVKRDTSLKVVDVVGNPWMVQAPPLKITPTYVPKEYYKPKLIGFRPDGFSFAYRLILIYDRTNTPNKTDDDLMTSECVFEYVN